MKLIEGKLVCVEVVFVFCDEVVGELILDFDVDGVILINCFKIVWYDFEERVVWDLILSGVWFDGCDLKMFCGIECYVDVLFCVYGLVVF